MRKDGRGEEERQRATPAARSGADRPAAADALDETGMPYEAGVANVVRGTDVADGAAAVLAALDPEQREVALAVRGPVCVLAGAGTGKTRAITHRIAYAVHTGVVDPAHVLAVTFTSRAAGELRGRLRLLGAPGPRARPGAGPDLPLRRAAPAHPLLARGRGRAAAPGARVEGQPGRRGGPGPADRAQRRGPGRHRRGDRMGQGHPGPAGRLSGRGRAGGPPAAARRRPDRADLRRRTRTCAGNVT